MIVISCVDAMNLGVNLNCSLCLAMNNKRENIYCDWRGKSFKILNNSLHESLPLELVIILTNLF
jgi:hypothetical protein